MFGFFTGRRDRTHAANCSDSSRAMGDWNHQCRNLDPIKIGKEVPFWKDFSGYPRQWFCVFIFENPDLFRVAWFKFHGHIEYVSKSRLGSTTKCSFRYFHSVIKVPHFDIGWNSIRSFQSFSSQLDERLGCQNLPRMCEYVRNQWFRGQRSRAWLETCAFARTKRSYLEITFCRHEFQHYLGGSQKLKTRDRVICVTPKPTKNDGCWCDLGLGDDQGSAWFWLRSIKPHSPSLVSLFVDQIHNLLKWSWILDQ